jgi:hypothetical protein
MTRMHRQVRGTRRNVTVEPNGIRIKLDRLLRLDVDVAFTAVCRLRDGVEHHLAIADVEVVQHVCHRY